MGRGLRYLLFVLVLAVSLGVSYAAYTVAGLAWDAVVGYRSPYASLAGAATKPAPPVSDRVVLVIIDGLRLDAARSMPALSRLSEYASDYVLTAPQPSLSFPNWTTVLSGAPQSVSGVVTNWHEGSAPVDTLLDSAQQAGVPYVVVGPQDLATLFPAAKSADGTFMRPWTKEYMAETYVDATMRLVDEHQPRFVLLHIPDVDEAGHDFGGSSGEYADAVSRVDADLRRLIEGLQDANTTFVVVSDHGHIDSGGHGGWEAEAVQVRGVFGGQGVNLVQGSAALEDVAPTAAVLAGIPVPGHATGEALAPVIAAGRGVEGLQNAAEQHREFAKRRIDVVLGPQSDMAEVSSIMDQAEQDPNGAVARAEELRLAQDRNARLPYGAAVIVAAIIAIALVGVASWRALVAAAAGAGAYYFVYNVLYFVVHDYVWSLSAFNSEDLVESWMNTRMLEAIVAGLIGAAIAGFVYPLLRQMPMGPRGTYLPGWLTLGSVTVLVTQATLAIQVGWFVWWWGLTPEWRLQDLMWAFKADLDMVQATALGAVALLAPVVTYLVGRYHPKVRAAPKPTE